MGRNPQSDCTVDIGNSDKVRTNLLQGNNILGKKPSQITRHPVHHYQLTRHLSLPLPLIRGRVPDLGALKMKPFKHPPNVRMVVDADHHLAFAATHKDGHALVVFKRKFDAIACGLPVGRIHVMEGVRPVVTLCAFKPWQILNVGAG